MSLMNNLLQPAYWSSNFVQWFAQNIPFRYDKYCRIWHSQRMIAFLILLENLDTVWQLKLI